MKVINLDSWKRIKHYNFYKDFDFPLFSISLDIDITAIIEYVKAKNIKFFPTFIYVMMKAMNRIDEFKYRIRGDQVVLHDQVTPSYTVLNENELYVFCTTEYEDDFERFTTRVLEDIEESKHSDRLEDIPGRDDLVFISSLPWIRFKNTTHPIDTKHPDSFPRITFGQYFKENDRYLMPFCVFVHHGLCDGLHVSRLVEYMTEEAGILIKR